MIFLSKKSSTVCFYFYLGRGLYGKLKSIMAQPDAGVRSLQQGYTFARGTAFSTSKMLVANGGSAVTVFKNVRVKMTY